MVGRLRLKHTARRLRRALHVLRAKERISSGVVLPGIFIKLWAQPSLTYVKAYVRNNVMSHSNLPLELTACCEMARERSYQMAALRDFTGRDQSPGSVNQNLAL
jgi:hypothetical protein